MSEKFNLAQVLLYLMTKTQFVVIHLQNDKLAMFTGHKTCKTDSMEILRDVTSCFRALENNQLHTLHTLSIRFEICTILTYIPYLQILKI